LDSGFPAALGPVKLVHAELPDGHRLKNCALAAVVPPDQQVEVRELVRLRGDALEVFQHKFGDH
jgi:hypothetical protein